ncbi:putative peroxygenase 5 [Carex littledalei]|uniref:Putative peroxygenase 5 n=1 Tax=Carex littledalei TaxID=544730 RepID=A0A833R268_9POAL|nr:putative peroxygenase 5 [Carex littledalei]
MLTPLQMHASFFDRDKNGLVYLKETYEGLRAIGLGVVRATSLALVINGGLSPSTSPNKIPSPLLPIYVENISRGKHGSDSGAYDSEGRFVPEKFEEIFKKYAKVNPNALTSEEVDEMLKGNEQPNDPIGHSGSMLEWRLLYDLAKDKYGFLHNDTARSVFDGSLFYRLERERAS